jgi:hypothetical protein
MENEFRLIGIFGKREIELAAIKIIDFYEDHSGSYIPINVNIFKSDYEKAGWIILRGSDLINAGSGMPTSKFWEKVKDDKNSAKGRPRL